MRLSAKTFLVTLLVVLAGCGSGNAPRFLLNPPEPEQRFDVRYSRIELREVSLPAYAAAPDIAVQGEGGDLRNLPDALWADDPVRGVTMALARSLDEASDAVVAAEPWPLDAPADLRVEVRVEQMLARADGRYEISGHYAYYAPEGSGRGSLRRFSVAAPISGEGARGVADAAGAALALLAREILSRL
ncbi:PqiC family protein [Albidovulum aquaemixtae]|uniref:PqiC family protein n=1 Tax=Albidovulum aquaemixtae TaxID=1542388 RepID=UPI001FE52318|nr:ABC-type transport auxiliary lipoprotein family protein [Defluviimonas aquaemixtae]